MTATMEQLVDLWFADATPDALAELAQHGAAALAEGDLERAAMAKSAEARHARLLEKQQHAVVVGAELLDMWPALRGRPVPEKKDPHDLRSRLVWGMKYVAGSAMDLPEIPLATTDQLLAAVGDMLAHYGFQQPALWQLQARRAFIAGDGDVMRDLVAKIGPTATRYHHRQHCGDCPGCVLTQFASWLGPNADAADVEDVLAPIVGTRPFPPEPGALGAIYDLLYGSGACDHAQKSTPIYLSRAYTRAGRLGEALREAERAMQVTQGEDANLPTRALVARTAVALAMGEHAKARAYATDIVERTRHLEDVYERLDAILVAHAALGDAALAADALAMAERLDARIEKKRHVAATRAALGVER